MDLPLPAKLTKEEYDSLCNQEQWEIDGYDNEDDYERDTVMLVQNLVKQADACQSRWRNACKNTLKEVETANDVDSYDLVVPNTGSGRSLPLLRTQVLETAALLSANPALPTISSPSSETDLYAATLNKGVQIELECNRYKELVNGLAYDGEFFNLGVLNITVDEDGYGPFGQRRKLCIDLLDPSRVYIDPDAPSLRPEDAKYVVVESMMDLGEIRDAYRERGNLVEYADAQPFSMDRGQHRFNNMVQTPIKYNYAQDGGEAKLVKVYECWLRDLRLKFEPDEGVQEGEEETDPELYPGYRVDKDGYISGRWVPRYPGGRVIVTAGPYVLKDAPNPWSHNHFPFVFYKPTPSRKLLVPGDAFYIHQVTRKIDQLQRSGLRFADSEVERPILASINALAKPRQWWNMRNKSNDILWLNSNQQFNRMEPSDLPPFYFPMLQFLQQQLDNTSGISGVLRGNIADGAQMSAEALNSLQSFASARLKQKATALAETAKELGYQLMWCMRDLYREKINLTINGPDGEPVTVDWTGDRIELVEGTEQGREIVAAQSYLVDIEPGTGIPGSQEQQAAQALTLFKANGIDRIVLLQRLGYKDAAQIDQRMKQAELERLTAQAAGKAFGADVMKAIDPNKKAGQSTGI